MTKITTSFISICVIAMMAFALHSCSTPQSGEAQSGATQSNEPWTAQQLLPPAELAKTLNDPNSAKPILLSIGFGGGISGSKEMGASRDNAGMENLKQELSTLPKDADIVIYCGCCPYKDCPNVRPAFQLLNEMEFTHHKLLDLPNNLKVDWIDPGYPMNN